MAIDISFGKTHATVTSIITGKGQAIIETSFAQNRWFYDPFY